MRRFTRFAICLAAAAGAAPLQAQASPSFSAGGGWAVALAQENSYASSIAKVAHISFTAEVRGLPLTTEALFVQTVYGDANVCDIVSRPCPQAYSVAGGAILARSERTRANGTPPRVGFAGGLGVYLVRSPKTSNRVGAGVQGDVDMVLVRQGHVDIVLAAKALIMPRVRQDVLGALPLTLGLRWW